MTINNSNINPYPTANPYTSRLYGNNNCCWNKKGFVHCSQDQQVPLSTPFSEQDKQYWDNVSVPNGEVVPMGCEGQIMMNPRINHNIFKCPDGTLIDLNNRKVISQQQNQNGCWGDTKINNPFSRDDEWNDKEIINSIINCNDGLSKEDLEYNNFLKEKEQELKYNLTEYQKFLLNNLENGKIIRTCKLVDV